MAKGTVCPPNCERRSGDCHGKCEEYLAYFAARREDDAVRRRVKDNAYALDNFRQDNIRKNIVSKRGGKK